jgi:hypothetical protein
MDVSGQLHATAALPPGKEHPIPTVYEAEYAPELAWTRWRGEIIPAPARNRTPVVQPVA